MSDGENDGIFGILIGIGIGLIAAILLLKKETTTQTVTSKLENKLENSPLGPLFGWRPLGEIPSVDRLGQYKPMPICDQEINSTNSETESGITHTYKNSEKIRILRGPDKRIIGYDTDRDAKINEQ